MSRALSRAGAGLVFLCAAVPLGGEAFGHAGEDRRLDVTIRGTEVDVSATSSALEASISLGLGADAAATALQAAAAPLLHRLGNEVRIEAALVPCRVRRERARVDGARLTLVLGFACPSSDQLTLSDFALADGGHSTRIVIDDGRARRLVIASSSESVPLGARGWFETFAVFAVQGAWHLFTGYDHILFLLTLVVGASWAARHRGRFAALRSMAAIVTAFTVGHSVTLALAAIGGITLDAGWVEAVIALSIVLAAAVNLLRPEAANDRPSVALAFGLVHGFGFSAVLAEVGLPAGHRALALMSFNVGIEVAQLALVALVLVPLMSLAERRWYRPVVATAGSGVAALLGLIWFAERTNLL